MFLWRQHDALVFYTYCASTLIYVYLEDQFSLSHLKGCFSSKSLSL